MTAVAKPPHEVCLCSGFISGILPHGADRQTQQDEVLAFARLRDLRRLGRFHRRFGIAPDAWDLHQPPIRAPALAELARRAHRSYRARDRSAHPDPEGILRRSRTGA